jgi:hypothetical protein
MDENLEKDHGEVYGKINMKPYTVPIIVHRPTREWLIRDFPDVEIIE